MKQCTLLLFSSLLLLFNSCGSSNNTAIDYKATDTMLALSVDTSSTEGFISSFCTQRETKNEQEDFSIKGTQVFTKGSFKIFNFTESIGDYQWQYSIVLNPETEIHFENPDKDAYIEAQQLMLDNQFRFSIFMGHLNPSYDFQKDKSADFMLVYENSYRTDFHQDQTVVLYNGVNALTVTPIEASTSLFYDGDDETGTKETFEFVEYKNKPVKIILHHSGQDLSREIVEELQSEYTYDLTWQWSKKPTDWGEPEWLTGLICNYSESQHLVDYFSECQTRISDRNGEHEFQVVENCANGGNSFFMLVPDESETSSYYFIENNEDDVGRYVAISIEELDSITWKINLARIEKFEANVQGYPEILPEFEQLYITRDTNPDHTDIEWHDFSDFDTQLFPYTRTPENYTVWPCP